MPVAPEGLRRCYLHPGRVAVRPCAECGKPICKECADEGDGSGVCGPCREAMTAADAGVSSAPIPMSSFDRKPPVAGEVTVFSDGSVDTPEIPPMEKETGPEALEAASEPGEVEDRDIGRTSETTGVEPDTGAAVPAEGAVLPGAEDEVIGPAGGKETDRECGKPEPGAGDSKVAIVPEGDGGKKKRGGTADRQPSDSTASQVLFSTCWGLGAAVLIYGAFLMIAWLVTQWNQVAVFIVGIAVPWSMYHGSTSHKRYGMPVWSKPPRNMLWISIPSFLIVAISTLAVEFLAYKVMYTTNSAIPFSDFISRFFGPAGWTLAGLGLLLSFLFPFFLSIGEKWSKPGFMSWTEKDRKRLEPERPRGQDPFAWNSGKRQEDKPGGAETDEDGSG